MAYYGIGPDAGKVVEDEDAYAYALERSLRGTPDDQAAFREALMEWFYSGNWIKEASNG